MDETRAPLPTFGDALEKYNPDPSLSTRVTSSSSPTTKWKQLPFPGRIQTSPTKPSKPSKSSKPLKPPIQTVLFPSRIKSRKASSVLSNSISKKRSSSSRYAPPSKYASVNNLLTDSIGPNLITLFIGLNPGIQTATSGHAYAHPSNLFWRLLHRSGCTPRLCRPTEDGDMPRLYSLGLTNIVARPTKDGAELSKNEMDDGVAELERKIELHRPEAVAVVGKSIWESIWRVKHGRAIQKAEFRYGWQADGERMGRGGLGGREENSADHDDEGENRWVGAKVFVATTTSGLAASMSLKEKEEVWSMLGSWVEQRRQERVEVAMQTRPEGEAGHAVICENEAEKVAS